MLTDLPNIGDLAKRVQDAIVETDGATADAAVTAAVGKVREANTLKGILLPGEDAIARVEAVLRFEHDEALAQRFNDLDRDLRLARVALEHAIREAEMPPREENPLLHELRTMNLRERFRGRTLREVVELYAGSGDADNPTLAMMVERDRRALGDLQPHPDDAAAELELRALVAARQAKRVPAGLREQLTQVTALRQGATIDGFIRLAHSGELAVASRRDIDQRDRLRKHAQEQRRLEAVAARGGQ